MLDALRKSYLHGWTLKGAHACFVTYTQHAVKCKNATIPPWPKSTFHRWLKTERENYEKSPDNDEQLPLQRHPIRHESQVHGLLRNLKEERAFTRSTNPQEEPLLTHARNGSPCKFDPLWYPELITMTEESLDSIGFGPETIQVCATQIYTEKLSLTPEDASCYTPSDRWCYWFMRQKMGLSLRCTSP